MKIFVTTCFITALIVLHSGHVSAQSKIGYVSVQELISIMPEARKADSTLQQFRTSLIQNAQLKQSSLEDAIEKFNKDSTSMNAAAKQAKRAEFQKMLGDLQQEQPRMQQQMQNKQQELIDPIREKALNAIQAVAKENGYTHIFDKQTLVIQSPGDDVLKLVAKKLNITIPAAPQRPATPGK